jgi:hypothetical protein
MAHRATARTLLKLMDAEAQRRQRIAQTKPDRAQPG